MKLFQHDKLTVRLLENNDDALLVKWLSDPQVLEFYEGRDRPHDIELVRKHFFENREGITACIIQYDNVDIGYIQYYVIDVEERLEYGYSDFQGLIYGLDQFIGEAAYWNRGIGTQLIKNMIQHLVEHEHADKIVMDPQVRNSRALHVYEKCGFKKIKLLANHERHEGELRDCWLIEYDHDLLAK